MRKLLSPRWLLCTESEEGELEESLKVEEESLHARERAREWAGAVIHMFVVFPVVVGQLPSTAHNLEDEALSPKQ